MKLNLPYGRHSIDDDDIAAVVEVLKSDRLTTGPAVQAFEEQLRRVMAVKNAVACSSGTAALHLALMGLEVVAGEKVVVPNVTFAATANAVRYIGAIPVISDVDGDTGLMTPETLAETLERAAPVAAVIPVHMAGQVCDMKAIFAIANQHAANVIEDACHAIGGFVETGTHKDPVGSCRYSSASAFSFHPVKTVAMGEGGAITTNDEEVAARMRRLRHHGLRYRSDGFLIPEQSFTGDDENPWYHEAGDLGFNYRASDIQCALGRSQLGKLTQFVLQRARIVETYTRLLEPLSPVVQTVVQPSESTIGWHLMVALIDFESAGISRARLMKELESRGIGTQVHYIPLHRMPAFRPFCDGQSFPGAESYYARCLSLPLFFGMKDDEVKFVVDNLSELLFG